MKNVSAKLINSYCKERKFENVILNYVSKDSEFSVSINPYLTLDEISTFVDRVVNHCFIDDNYYPEYKDAIFKITFMQMCTNIPVPTEEENINIQASIDIMDKFNLIENAKSKFSEVDRLINKLEQNIEEKIKFVINQKLSQERSKLVEAISVMDSYTKIMEKTFDGVNINELLKSTTVISNKLQNIPEKDVVNTIVDSLQKENMSNLATSIGV